VNFLNKKMYYKFLSEKVLD